MQTKKVLFIVTSLYFTVLNGMVIAHAGETFRDPLDSAIVAQKYNNLRSGIGYHTGIDYVGDANMLASASGKVVMRQTNGGPSCIHPKDGQGREIDCNNPSCGEDDGDKSHTCRGCNDHGLGNTVILEHTLTDGSIVYSQYSHMDSIDASIQVGQCIVKGTKVGVMGGTGQGCDQYWNTPHLHFEMKKNNVLENPLGDGIHYGYTPDNPDNYGYYNPNNYIDQSNVQAVECGEFSLSVRKTGDGDGRIVSTPDGINCGLSCNTSFSSGAIVTLSVQDLTPGSMFVGWSGAGCNGTGTCRLTMDGNKTVTAEFGSAITHRLNVTKNGAGSGRITSSPGGIDCGGDCNQDYSEGTTVLLYANADPGSWFVSWGGDCSGNACAPVMNSDKNVSAAFDAYEPGNFSDDPIEPGVTQVRDDHIWELRNSINDLRHAYGLLDYNFRDPDLNTGDSIRAVHIQDLRLALNEVYAKIGEPPPGYTDPNLAEGTEIRHEHVQEIRDILKTWNPQN